MLPATHEVFTRFQYYTNPGVVRAVTHHASSVELTLLGGSEIFTRYKYYVGQCKAAAKVTEADEFDLFGEETVDEKESLAKMAAAKKQETKKPKKEVIGKSTLVIDIKPSSLSVDLGTVERLVREIKMEGVEWSEASKRVPVAFGLFKLQLGCVIIDSLVNTDEILEKIECVGMSEQQAADHIVRRDTGEDLEIGDDEESPFVVASAEIASFQKL